jgi:hypothetical protein
MGVSPGMKEHRIMASEIAPFRREVEKIDGVSRTWLEWNLENSEMIRMLVVEVDFDTDPDAEGFKRQALHDIESAALNVLMDAALPTTRLKVVPKLSR